MSFASGWNPSNLPDVERCPTCLHPRCRHCGECNANGRPWCGVCEARAAGHQYPGPRRCPVCGEHFTVRRYGCALVEGILDWAVRGFKGNG